MKYYPGSTCCDPWWSVCAAASIIDTRVLCAEAGLRGEVRTDGWRSYRLSPRPYPRPVGQTGAAGHQREWTVLDTCDALSATYDYPQTDKTTRRACEENGFSDATVQSGSPAV
jgi:hypothetical protein